MSPCRSKAGRKRRWDTVSAGTQPASTSASQAKKPRRSNGNKLPHQPSPSPETPETPEGSGVEALAAAVDAAADRLSAKKARLEQRKAAFLQKFSGKTPEEILGTWLSTYSGRCLGHTNATVPFQTPCPLSGGQTFTTTMKPPPSFASRTARFSTNLCARRALPNFFFIIFGLY